MAKEKRINAPFTLCPVMVITGEEQFLRRQELDQIRAAVFGKEPSGLGYILPEPSLGITAILDECRTAGMFAPKKLVVVSPADALFKAGGGRASAADDSTEDSPDDDPADTADSGSGSGTARELLLRYAQAPTDGTTLVLVCNTWLGTTRLHKFLQPMGAIRWCEPVDPADATGWLTRRCKSEYAKTITPPAANLLLELVGADLSRLDGELAKLSLFDLNSTTITPEMVNLLVGFQHDQQVWALIDALAVGNAAAALATHDELWQMDNKIGYTLVGAIFYWLGQVLRAREMLDRRMPEAEISKALRLWQRGTQTIALAKRLGLAGSRRISAALLVADIGAKTSLGDHKRNMEIFIVQLCARTA